MLRRELAAGAFQKCINFWRPGGLQFLMTRLPRFLSSTSFSWGSMVFGLLLRRAVNGVHGGGARARRGFSLLIAATAAAAALFLLKSN